MILGYLGSHEGQSQGKGGRTMEAELGVGGGRKPGNADTSRSWTRPGNGGPTEPPEGPGPATTLMLAQGHPFWT